MTDAQLMKSTRKALGLTQTEMAKKLGYAHQQSISYIERGAANLLVSALNVTITNSRDGTTAGPGLN